MSESEKSVTEAASAAFEGVEGAVGLGVDIVEIARMRRILERTPSFREKVFSEEERSYCESTANPEVHYATRFAAKEAVLKALGTGFSRGIANHDVEVRRNAKGRPFVVLHGRAKEVADERGVRELPLSLSYTHTDAVACALAITEESVRAQEERVNPMEELAKQNEAMMLEHLIVMGIWLPEERRVFEKCFEKVPEFFCVAVVRLQQKEYGNSDIITLAMVEYLKKHYPGKFTNVYSGLTDELFLFELKPEQEANVSGIKKLFDAVQLRRFRVRGELVLLRLRPVR